MVYMNQDVKIAGAATAGAVAGAVQTALLREFADNTMAKGFLKNTSATPPLLMKQLQGFGSPSALAGIIGGAVSLILGLASMLKSMVTRNMAIGAALVGYGSTALFTGVLSGAFPTTAWQAATSADPNNPVGAASVQRNIIPNTGVYRPEVLQA